mgnify:CR=1 FL=1
MSKDEAIKVLVNVARAAQKAGVFALEDAEVVLQAVRTVEAPQEAPAAPEKAPEA